MLDEEAYGQEEEGQQEQGIDLYDADHHLTGEESGDEAGVGVDGAGDVDGDGLADLLIGSNGQAYLVLGGSLGSSGTLSLSEADHTFLEEVQQLF